MSAGMRREGSGGARPREARTEVALESRTERAYAPVDSGGSSRYRGKSVPYVGEIQVVPRTFVRPEQNLLGANFFHHAPKKGDCI